MRKLQPTDPRAHQAVMERIRTMSREEVLAMARSHPGFDESWVKPVNGQHDGVDTAATRVPGSRGPARD
jgi:hypothetical protein